jgi:integrase
LFAGRARQTIKSIHDEVKFEDTFEKFLKSSRRREFGEKRLNQYKSIWNKFISYIQIENPEIVKISQITEKHAEEWASSLIKNKGKRSCNVFIGSVKTIFSILSPDHNPFRFVKKINESPVSINDFTENEIRQIFLAIDEEMHLNFMDRTEAQVLFRIGAYTGLRLKDSCCLKWDAVKLDRRIIILQPAKTIKSSGRHVNIPIHPNLEKSLRIALEWKDDSGFILPNIARRYSYNPTGVQKDTQKVIHWALWKDKKEGLRPPKMEKYGFHSFRHSFVSFCANAGVPLPVVQAIVGHASVAITRFYIHLGEDSIKKAIDALPSMENDKKINIISSDEKLSQIQLLLNSKARLSDSDKKILEIIQSPQGT